MYPCGNDGRDWQPLPDQWSDCNVTSGELLFAELRRRDETHPPVVADDNLTVEQRADYVTRYSQQRLRDTHTTERIRFRGGKESQERPIPSQHMPCGPSIRRRWPKPHAGPWPRLRPRYGPFPDERRELVEHSSSDRGWVDLKAGSGRVHKPKRPKPLPKLPAPDDITGWEQLTVSDKDPYGRVGSRLGDYFDDVVSDTDERWADDNETRAGSDWTYDMPQAERQYGLERSRARLARGIMNTERTRAEGETRATYRDKRGVERERRVARMPILGSWIDEADPCLPKDPPRGAVHPELFPLGWSRTELRDTGERTREDLTSGHLTGTDPEGTERAAFHGVVGFHLVA